MLYLNYTPHQIVVTGPLAGNYDSKGVARVAASFEEVSPGIFYQVFGQVEGLPGPEEGVKYIVSGLVLAASDRNDLVAPASGMAQRNEKGHIVSVPGFVK